jgi:phage terminase large subunit-like protein
MVLSKTINCSIIHMFTTKPMNPYIEEQQIDELIPLDWDDEETKFEVEDYYDDLTAGIDFSNTNDF